MALAMKAALSRPAVAITQRRGRRRSARSIPLRIGSALIVSVLLLAIIGPLVFHGSPTVSLGEVLLPPSAAHPFGTDNLGRDVFIRTLHATWLDLGLALAVTCMAVILGLLLGTVAGYFRGWPERIIMRVVDVLIAFPFIVLVIAIVAVFGPGLKGVAIGLVLVGWVVYARLARGEMLVLNEKSFIQAARTLGFSHRRVMFGHAAANLLRPILVFSMSDLVNNLLALATLSFLGLGAQPPTPEWGAIIADGQPFLLSAWWITTLPGLFVVLVGLGFSLIGDGLADRLDVRRSTLR